MKPAKIARPGPSRLRPPPPLRKEVPKSPQEIEDEIKSTPTVTWNPFTVLPREIYLKIFDLLDYPIDKRNFMNAHPAWYDLFKGKRTNFLFQEVLKEMDLTSVEDYGYWHLHRLFQYRGGRVHLTSKECSNFRLVCKDWDKGVQSYFQWHPSHYRMDGVNQVWSPNKSIPSCRFENDANLRPVKSFGWSDAGKLRRDFAKFSLTHQPTMNPFLSRSLTLVMMPLDGYRPVHLRELELEQYENAVRTLLETYGQHIWHCKIEIRRVLNVERLTQLAKWLSLMPRLRTLVLDDREAEDNSKIRWMESDLANIQQPKLKMLMCLKSSYISSPVFNKLIGRLHWLEKIQIKILKGANNPLRSYRLLASWVFLKEAFFTVKGIEDFKLLQIVPTFQRLTKLVIALEFETKEEREKKAYAKWPEWRMIWSILEEKFPALEDLTLRLPKADSEEDKKKAKEQSWECRLNLKKLKRLWLALPNVCSLDFLLPCKALKDLKIVREHRSKDSRICARERLKFNIELGTMSGSNLWEEFPKLEKVKIEALAECQTRWVMDSYSYEKIGDKMKYSEDAPSKRKRQLDSYTSPLANLH